MDRVDYCDKNRRFETYNTINLSIESTFYALKDAERL